MKKRNYILTVILAAAVLVTGCGEKSDKKAESAADQNSTGDVLDFDAEEYVKLGDYKGLDVTYPSVQEITDQDVEQYIQEQLEENIEYKEVDRASKEGDTVNIDYTGTINGEEFEGGSDTEYDLELGSQDFLPEFEESLVGKKAGETAVFTLTFPSEDYDESVAGQEAEFTVKINSVSETVTPEYNLDFVKSISDYETLEEYEASVKEELITYAEDESETEKGEHALRLVMNEAELKGFPQTLYDFFYEDTVSGYKSFAEMQGMEYEEFLESFMSEEDIKEVVEEQVNDHLISQAILQKEGVALTDEEYAKAGEELAVSEGYGSLEEYEEDYGKISVTAQMVREKAIDILKESVNLQEVPWDEYDEYGEDLESEDEES